MKSNKINFINILLYFVALVFLMTIATIFDLEISHILVGSSLNKGEYYSSSLIGSLVEIIGCFPIFLAPLFATLIHAKNFYVRKNKTKYIAILFFIGSIIDITWFIKDTFKYASNIYGFSHIYELDFMIFIYIAIGIILSFLSHYLYRFVSIEKNQQLKVFAYIIFASCSFHILVELIKGPIGRMRYRAMNVIDDFSYFTPWYEISSAKNMVVNNLLGKDAFKSFPSGHTHAAGLSYLLICVPDLFKKFDSKKYRILSYIIPIIFTGFVAFYRIRVGAHFLSDVVIGGTLSFTTVSVFRYIFLLKKGE